MGLGSLDHRLHDGAIGGSGAEHQIRHDAVERGTRRLSALAAFEVGIDREFHRLENRDRHFGKPAPPHLILGQAAERRLLKAFDAHRHDFGV